MKLRVFIWIFFLFVTDVFSQSFSLVSWNIQDFGQSKNEKEMQAIARMVRDFDIIAIQEVVAKHPGGAKAVARLADELMRMGGRWDYRISDPTKSPGRRSERYAFIWNRKKVQLQSRPWLEKSDEPVIYREPYLARFKVEGEEVLIVNYHSRGHDEYPQEEIECFLKYPNRFSEDRIIIAGDFNTYPDARIFSRLQSIGLVMTMDKQKTTLKRKCGWKGSYLNHPIDHILYDRFYYRLIESGVIDFVQDCRQLKKARTISDHLPVYATFTWR